MRLFISLLVLLSTSLAVADEGMWTLNGFPTTQVQQKYKFTASKKWLDHVRLASIRLAEGCSGSFISSNGLVMTNHHCAHTCIEQLSTAGKDFVASGFYAKTEEKEVKCPESEVNQLIEITDITSKITAATQGLEGQKFNDAQKSEMSKIEKECSGDSDRFRCDVVTLYHGGQYHLYKYRRYQDVRLVFAPELAIAFFGGDPDNFMFPRYDYDVSLLRVYKDGKPLQNKDYFKWSTENAKEGDLSFVTGHPGRTSRLNTISQLEFQRDVSMLKRLFQMSELRGILTEFQNRGIEQKRISGGLLFGIENSLKAIKGEHQALLDKTFFAQKVAEETSLRKKINANPAWKKAYGTAWDEITQAYVKLHEIHTLLVQLENNRDFNSKLFGIAKTLVRAATELPKPNGKRFREFADSNLPQIKQDLFSTAPIYEDFEIALLTFALTKLRENLTADHPAVKKIFGSRSPNEIATSIVEGSKLKNIEYRKKLFEGGEKEILASKDPMILFAMLMDPESRAVRKKYEDEIEPMIKKNAEKIAKAQFAVYGTGTYPDATFTLRISYGTLKGYPENGATVKPITTVSGAYNRHTGRDPFALPDSWLVAKNALNLDTPFNFCSTNDIIGGNSGSPVINKDAEIIGLIFDGNIQSLGGEFGFDESVNRAVAVHSAVLLEALRKVYSADRIADEIQRK